MYEKVQDLWKEYLAKHGSWGKTDPRKGLSAEVTRRLQQLDLILEKLDQARTPSAEDQAQSRKDDEHFLKTQKQFASGEITSEEFAAGLRRKSPEEIQGLIRRTNDVWLFTETFYCIAWRLREVLNIRKPASFPNLQKIDGLGIRSVRNLLIEHPEDQKDKPNYEQTMTDTNDGPVLKSLEVRIDGQTGQSSSAKDSVDRGLYINAQEFKDEMERAITKAIN
jgi:hypothetical protein